jgi:3-hydroxyacyl-[acyl-carrier-protein] dehydratase
MEKPLLDVEEIRQRLPHRYPFLLVDRVLSMTDAPKESVNSVGSKLHAVKNVTANEPFFTGHFPDQMVMPGVMMVEALAQAAALLAHRPHPVPGNKWTYFIMSVDNARFRKIVVPGDQLNLHVECTKDRGAIFVFHCEGHVAGEKVVECDIMAKRF